MAKRRDNYDKPTAAEKAMRVNRVYELLLNGVSRAGIIRFFSEPRKPDGTGGMGLALTDRTIDNYIAEATELLLVEGGSERSDDRKKTNARLEHLFARNMARGDLNGARLALADKRKLLGLDEPSKHEVGGKGGGPIEIETNAVKQMLIDQMVAIALGAGEQDSDS